MISLCQVERGFPTALGRAPGSSISLFIASRLSLSARFLRITQNQTSIRCIELFPTVTEELSECYLPVSKHFEGGLGSMSSVAQSATAGPGRSR